jgi:hypothetical protein
VRESVIDENFHNPLSENQADLPVPRESTQIVIATRDLLSLDAVGDLTEALPSVPGACLQLSALSLYSI